MTPSAVVALKRFEGPSSRVTEEVVIGKDILDLLTGAMYVDPLSIYREYVQNAADAIEQANNEGLYLASSAGNIRIDIDPKARSIKILDNGIGIPQADFVRRLTALGASKKRGTNLRGFRGVGRLSGLGYCQELIFRARADGERKVSEMTWDGKRLKDLLRSEDHTDLPNAVRAIAETRSFSLDNHPPHFFEVELRGVRRIQNDVLLNEDAVHAYLCQVAPVRFREDFKFGPAITDFICKYSKLDTISLTLGANREVLRPHSDAFAVTDKVSDKFSEITFFEIPGIDEGLDAVGWFLNHSYFGAIPKRNLIAGIRARVGNMQIGTPEIFDSLFPQDRFNSWCVGELHVLTRKVIPNGRRDDFEVNAHLQNLHGHLAKHTKDLVKLCREKSVIRNRLKSAAALAETVSQSIALLEKSRFAVLKDHLSSYSQRLLGQLHSLATSESLRTNEKAFIADRAKQLSDRLQRAKGSHRIRSSFARIAPAKKKAYEEAIDAVLSSSLPLAVRADLAQKILRRAISKQ